VTPRRIHITGNAGSGKTTLALALGRHLNLPVHHLDSIVWQPGWRKTSPEVRGPAEASLVAGEAWIVDGVSDQVRAAADLVVFLDVARTRCLFRAFKRNLPFLFRSRPGLPERCPEILIAAKLIRIIFRFPERVGKKLAAEAGQSARYRLIRTQTDLARLKGELNIEQ